MDEQVEGAAEIAAEVMGSYVPLRPGDTLKFERSSDWGPGEFSAYVAEPASDGFVRIGSTGYAPGLFGRSALVIQHLAWDSVLWTSTEPGETEPGEHRYWRKPRLELYLVLCDGRLVYASREHFTARDKARSEAFSAAFKEMLEEP